MRDLKGCAFAVVALVALLATGPLFADQQPTKPPREVTVPLDHLPFDLKGYLRRPNGNGSFPAVILLPMCGALVNSVDQGWGDAVASWGYVVLTLDVFTARGIKGGKTCLYPAPPETVEDVHRALNWLAMQENIDRNRVFVVGFGRAGTVALSAVERDIEAKAKRRFRGAVAFYPSCGADKGIKTVATLVIVGALDKNRFEACRKMVQGDDDIGISRQHGEGISIKFVALPDAYSGFDVPAFQEPVEVRGFHLEFSNSATEQSKEILRYFLLSVGQ
jgi:dienelactone hydrolase